MAFIRVLLFLVASLFHSFGSVHFPMSDLLQPFLGALQASASVLLTISVGVIAAQFDLLDCDSAKCLSKFCVKLALPCLLIANVGKELDIETGYKYVPLLSKCLSLGVCHHLSLSLSVSLVGRL